MLTEMVLPNLLKKIIKMGLVDNGALEVKNQLWRTQTGTSTLGTQRVDG